MRSRKDNGSVRLLHERKVASLEKAKKPKIIVVGGGIGGLTAGLSLIKRGFEEPRLRLRVPAVSTSSLRRAWMSRFELACQLLLTLIVDCYLATSRTIHCQNASAIR